MDMLQTQAVIGLTLVEAQSPSVAGQIAPRLRRLARGSRDTGALTKHDRSEELVMEPDAVDEVLLRDMLDHLPPNWARRRAFYAARERLPGLRDEPAMYAAVDSSLGTRFDRTV